MTGSIESASFAITFMSKDNFFKRQRELVKANKCLNSNLMEFSAEDVRFLYENRHLTMALSEVQTVLTEEIEDGKTYRLIGGWIWKTA